MNVRKALFVSSLFLCGVGVLPVTAGLPDSHGNEEVNSSMQQQQKKKRTITGNVTDASNGEPLIGVSILLKGTTEGTTTDLDGNFSVSVPMKGAQLEFSYIGYKKQTMDVTDLVTAHVKMESDNEMLSEVVVVGAGTQKKISVTGAITAMKGSELTAPSSSLTNNFAGKLAGVISVTTSGEPGAQSQFYIRGIGTFGGRATPLILLDGVEISSGDLNNIPPESIESFSVLKDASATAIYGSRGANGVMLVTTKIGTENTKAEIRVTFENAILKPVNQVKYVDGARWMEIYNEAQHARTPNAEPKYSQERIDNTRSGINPYVYPDVDWYDLMFKESTMNQRANVNISGGGPKVSYYMSLQANHDTGMLDIPSNGVFDNNINNFTYVFQNNIAYKVTPTTRVDLRMNAQIGNQKGPNKGVSDFFYQAYNNNPVTFPAYFPASSEDKHIKYGNAILSNESLYVNPYANMLSTFKEANFSAINTSVFISQDLDVLTKGLKATALVNWKTWSYTWYDRSIQPYWYRVKEGSWSAENPSEYNIERVNNSGTEYISESQISRGTDNTFYLDFRLNYERTFAVDHSVTAMLMYMQREFRSEVLPNRNQGLSGRVTYAYKQKYMAEFNFGYNGTERLDKGNRFEFFPAMSLGWVPSSEAFWTPIEKYVDYFKLRGSYGLVGSDDTGSAFNRFLYVNNVKLWEGPSYGTGDRGDNLISNKKGPAFYSYAVANAHWERVKKLDVGIDMRILNQIDVSLDYFFDRRERILLKRLTWPAIMGYGSATPWSNVGKINNKGFEVSVNWKKELFKQFYVDLRGNFTYTENKWIYRDEPEYPHVWQTNTGKPLDAHRAYIAEGLFKDQEEIASSPNQEAIGGAKLMPGDIKYRDVNGDGRITNDDKVMVTPYSSTPRIQYGLGLNLTYKGFDFGAFFNGSAKRTIMINGIDPFGTDDGHGDRNVLNFIADDYWQENNPNPDAAYPRLGLTKTQMANNMVPSTYWMRNGNFIRFKTLSLGYSFPFCRVYVSGDNLAVWSPFKLWDPELWYDKYPLQRTFNLGVQFNLSPLIH